MRIFVVTMLVLSSVSDGGGGQAAAEEAGSPWTLRNRVRFSSGSAVLEYAEKSGAWRVMSTEGETVAESGGFLARLGAGRSVGSAGLAPAELHREHFEGPLGDGTYYAARFPVQDGLAFEHRVAFIEGRPFVLMSLSVSNRGNKAVTVEGLDVAVFSMPGAVSLGPEGRYESLPLAMRGGQAVFDERGPSLMGRFEDEGLGVCLTIGVAGGGDGSSGVQFERVQGQSGSVDAAGATQGRHWRGTVYTRFTPPLKVAPGETVRSADVVVVYGLIDRQGSEENYLWAAGTLWPNVATGGPSLTWLTGEETGDFDTLLEALTKWRGARRGGSLTHALIPAGWERTPGALQGAAPRYPKNMRDAADSLRKRGVTAGITIDPLAALSSSKPWVYTSAQGRAWLDLSDAEAQAFAEARIRGLAGFGFRFFAIEASSIPDDVLRHFGLTRSAASALAFEVARAAVPTLPVYPAAVRHLPSSDKHWSNARRALERLAEYGVPAAPIRVDITTVSDVEPLSLGVLLDWPGPLEIVGVPTRKVRRELGEILRQRASRRKRANTP